LPSDAVELGVGGVGFGGLGEVFFHDGFADGCQQDRCELEVLEGEGDADDGDRAGAGGEHMAKGEPPAGEEKP